MFHSCFCELKALVFVFVIVPQTNFLHWLLLELHFCASPLLLPRMPSLPKGASVVGGNTAATAPRCKQGKDPHEGPLSVSDTAPYKSVCKYNG